MKLSDALALADEAAPSLDKVMEGLSVLRSAYARLARVPADAQAARGAQSRYAAVSVLRFPTMMTERDFADALTFLGDSRRNIVAIGPITLHADPDAEVIWGVNIAGSIVIAAAGLDASRAALALRWALQQAAGNGTAHTSPVR
ncbi:MULTISPECIES: hypothetical protein [Xanthomonas]|uniref:hypothetical protein n=1 Tax=Xanthomonas TaxID=338 RepID=UPI00051E1017|nr:MULTISPECIES: hypothetical protein [Xanthomonas]KGK66394.1 hypothetical protein NB99_09055 [Xanthomonas citri pv. fuscans]KGU43534.1 hypothetical protein NY94_11660 [Xanthomonas phaseoli pv. phaseoli]